MRKLSSLLTAILMSAGAAPLLANWGSTAGGSVATGNFRSFGTDQVEMVRENLVIRLYRDRAKVEIDYVLRNTGAAVNVRAGFPSLGAQDSEHRHLEIEDYAISADGKPVAYTHEKGDPAPLKTLYEAKFLGMISTTDEEPGTEDQNLLLDWLVSTVHFSAGQSRHIHIAYDSLYAYCAGGYSDDSDACDDRFAYVLSTAAAWKGPIVDGRVTIVPVTMKADSLTISPPGHFRREKSGFVWQFHNLKPTLADNIVISMNNHSSTIADYSRGDADQDDVAYYVAEAGRYYYLFHDYEAQAAGSGGDSNVANVSDYRNDTEWRTIHSPGVGESLTLDLKKPVPVDQVGIMPGCGKDKEEWFSHARIREIKISVNGGHERTVTLPDEYISFWPASAKAYEWIDVPKPSGDAQGIRLEIESVYPGLKDQVTCISEILLRRSLPSRPKIKSGVDDHELP